MRTMSRRSFLGHTSAAAFAATLAPQFLFHGAAFAASPAGVLNIGSFELQQNLDLLKGGHIEYGQGELLTRTLPDGKLVGWVAESWKQVDPLTWQFALRKNVTFWDGTPLTATIVADCFKQADEAKKDNLGMIGKGVEYTAVDDHTLAIKTAKPNALIPNMMALSNWPIFKKDASGSAVICTGPYKTVKLDVDHQLTLEAYDQHWAGKPSIRTINYKLIEDPNARLLALQSGEIDFLFMYPPEFIPMLKDKFEVKVVPSGRSHIISLNFESPIFSDVNVRQAFSMAIDREQCNTVGLDGQGAVLTNLFSPTCNYKTIDFLKKDTAAAEGLLDKAGWAKGSDGVRAKGGQKLAFTIYTNPGRAEQNPMALSIQSQLKPLGFDIKVEDTKTLNDILKSGKWDAAFKANQMLNTGSPLYEYNRLLRPEGGDNVGGYNNPEVVKLIDQMIGEGDISKRDALSVKVLEIFAKDMPVIPVVAPAVTTAYAKGKLVDYTPNPNDSYVVTPEMKLS